ncbi:MAG: oligopeptide:H+ symporter [Proteobacteria bacterium]|nr:oligopeptide:H+ symporter [Pseudomonadota bacterium]
MKTNPITLFREQPKAFRMVFLLEIWERFGFYTMQGILTLYFIRFLGLEEKDAFYTFGAFSAIVYGLIVVGGFLGDKVLGPKRTIVLGLVTLAAGYLALALSDKNTVYYALGLICIGNGVFKANPANLLSKCYEKTDPRLHGGFTLYYMSINIGSIFAMFFGPTVAKYYGYFYAYFLSSIGLMLGLANFYWQKKLVKDINNEADLKKISLALWLLIIAGLFIAALAASYLLKEILIAKRLLLVISCIVLTIYSFHMLKEDRHTRKLMLVALVLMLEAILFFTLYQQMYTSLNLFGINNVRPNLLGIPIDPQSFQGLNPIWIVIMSPVIATFYKKMQLKGYHFSIAYKFAAGMLFCGLSFAILYFSRFMHDSQGMVSPWWMITSYFFQSISELLVSALGVAMVAELVPLRITGFVMGMWFLTSSIAGFTGAFVASMAALPKNLDLGLNSLMIYTSFFAKIGLVTIAVGIVMALTAGFLNRYINKGN